MTGEYSRNKKIFADTWQKFLAADTTIKNVDRDFVEWHKGRKQFAVWCIFPEDRVIKTIWSSAKSHMRPFLLDRYLRQPHITLYVCGFLVKTAQFADDFPNDVLQMQLNALAGSTLPPFELELGKLSSFTTAPFFEIIDRTGGIDKIRRVLESVSDEKRTAEYAPHLTVGLYDDGYPIGQTSAEINSFEMEYPFRFNVDHISLAVYDASQIAGPLAKVFEFDLISKKLVALNKPI